MPASEYFEDDEPLLEQGLPYDLRKAIDDLVRAREENLVMRLDVLMDELYGSINADYWGGEITERQAKYLRRKYLQIPDS